MEDKINAMDKEGLVAALSTCNEKLIEIRRQSKEEVKPLTDKIKQMRVALTNFMVKHEHECIQVNDDTFLRLFHRVGSGETLTPMLFMDIINKLTPQVFVENAKRVKAEQDANLEIWREKQRKEIRKSITASRKKAISGRLTKRKRLEVMAEAAETLGTEARSNIDLIMEALPCEVMEMEDVDALVEKILEKLPVSDPEPVVQVGRYTQHGPPPFHRPLTNKEMFVEVLYLMIKDRNKPLKPVITIDSRPGRSGRVETVAPKSVFDTVRTFMSLREEVARPQQELQSKRRDYRNVMTMCRNRLLPMLRTSKFEGSMPTPDGLRKISIDVVTSEVPRRKLTLVDMFKMLDSSSGAVVNPDAQFQERTARALLSEGTMSTLIKDVLRLMANHASQNTEVVEKVRLRRSKIGRRSGDYESDSDSDGSSDTDTD